MFNTAQFDAITDPSSIETEAVHRLSGLAWEHYQNKQGIEWAVASLLLLPPQIEHNDSNQLVDSWQDQVFGCKATSAEYAARATVAPHKKATLFQLADTNVAFYPKEVKELAFIYSARADFLKRARPYYFYQSNLFPYIFSDGREEDLKNTKNKNLLRWYAAGRYFFQIPDSRN